MGKKILSILFINIFLIIVFDIVFGLIFNQPEYLSKKNYDWGVYRTNYRNYFDEIEYKGEKVFGFDYSKINENMLKIPDENYQGTSVLAIGDSFTEGQGVRNIHTFSNMLSILSNDKFRGYNFGKGGDDIQMVYERFIDFKPAFKPDYIVYGYCINDIRNFNYERRLDIDNSKENRGEYQNDYPLKWDLINLRTNVLENSRSDFLKTLSSFSNILNWFITRYEMKMISERTIDYYLKTHLSEFNPDGIKFLKETLIKMKEKSQQYNAQFIIMMFPILFWPDNEYPLEQAHETIATLAQELDIPIIDLRNFYMMYKDRDLWVHPVDQHPNDFAHKITAQVLIKYLQQDGGEN